MGQLPEGAITLIETPEDALIYSPPSEKEIAYITQTTLSEDDTQTIVDVLKKEMRKHGVLFKITKNRITKLALEGTKFKKLENLFTGPTAVAFSDDAISSAKILTKFAKTNSNLKIIGGIMENEPLSLEEVEKIATLPTLEEARAKIVGILATPAQKIISILLAPGSKIAILAHAKSKKT